MNRMIGKVAIVTGAAGGIGAAAAQRFIDEGAAVLLVDRDESALRRVASELGEEAHLVVADVADPEAAQRYVAVR